MEKTLMQRLAAGDKDAMQAFLDRYGDLMWSIARRFTTNHAEAEDSVQEAAIEIWRNAGRYDPAKASESTFVTMITRRRLIDRLRRSRRRPTPEPLPDPDTQPSDQPGLSLDTQVDVQQAIELIDGLRDEQRNVLELGVFRGYSHSDIARVLDMPLGTVKTHLRRAMITIRERLEERAQRARERAT